jgi:hypothetical protein
LLVRINLRVVTVIYYGDLLTLYVLGLAPISTSQILHLALDKSPGFFSSHSLISAVFFSPSSDAFKIFLAFVHGRFDEGLLILDGFDPEAPPVHQDQIKFERNHSLTAKRWLLESTSKSYFIR